MCVPLPLQASSVRSHHRGVRSAIVREATALSAGVVMDDQMKVAWRGGTLVACSRAHTHLPQLLEYSLAIPFCYCTYVLVR